MAFSALVYSEKINRLYNVGNWKDDSDNMKVITGMASIYRLLQ